MSLVSMMLFMGACVSIRPYQHNDTIVAEKVAVHLDLPIPNIYRVIPSTSFVLSFQRKCQSFVYP